MKINELKNKIKGIFKLPVKQFYFGKIKFGTPYFNPINFLSSILYIRKLTKRTEEEKQKVVVNSYNKEYRDFYNLPMVRRNKYKIIKLFNNYFYIEIGFPIAFVKTELGWKDKFGTPRYEWSPAFQIFFFRWQFCIFYNAPNNDNDLYYEMILWYINYCNCDINNAKNTWSWTSYPDKKSTWNDNFLMK